MQDHLHRQQVAPLVLLEHLKLKEFKEFKSFRSLLFCRVLDGLQRQCACDCKFARVIWNLCVWFDVFFSKNCWKWLWIYRKGRKKIEAYLFYNRYIPFLYPFLLIIRNGENFAAKWRGIEGKNMNLRVRKGFWVANLQPILCSVLVQLKFSSFF